MRVGPLREDVHAVRDNVEWSESERSSEGCCRVAHGLAIRNEAVEPREGRTHERSLDVAASSGQAPYARDDRQSPRVKCSDGELRPLEPGGHYVGTLCRYSGPQIPKKLRTPIAFNGVQFEHGVVEPRAAHELTELLLGSARVHAIDDVNYLHSQCANPGNRR
jgi:hypothetical protein